MKTWILLSLMWTVGATAWAAQGSVTVISVTGEVSYRTDGGSWTPLRGGERLAENQQVRTAPEAALAVITAQGAVVRIPGGREQPVVANAPAEGAAGTGTLTVLRELFSDARRARVAASRGAEDPASPAGQAELTRAYGEIWEHLSRAPRMSRDDLPSAFEAAAFFQDRPLQNRSLSLLTRMASEFPDDAGFAGLAHAALESFGQPAKLVLHANPAGAPRALRSGETVKGGEVFQVNYASETESFFYLYLRSVPAQGGASSTRIHPPAGSAPRAVPPAMPLVLPEGNSQFAFDEEVGREYFWAWSCTGRIAQDALEKRAVTAVEQLVAQPGAFTDAAVRQAAPPGCFQGFAYALEHR